MKDRAPAVDAHAYVDNCLAPEERKAFEARLREDEELRRRVEAWQAQSEAIRSAFGAQGQGQRPDTADRRPGPARLAIRSALPQARGESSEAANRPIAASRQGEGVPTRSPFRRRRVATVAALLWIGVTFFPSSMAYPPPGALADIGAAAFRAFSVAPLEALDFRGGGPESLASLLGPSFAAARLTEWVAPSGWELRGAKRVPGLEGEAALILLAGRERRPLGILVEPLDAPASSPIADATRGDMSVAAFTRRGYGFAVVGPAGSGVADFLSAAGFLGESGDHPTE